MADLIQIKRGVKATMPTLNNYELGYCTDEKALYIGTTDGNVKLCGADELANIYTKIDEITARLDALKSE